MPRTAANLIGGPCVAAFLDMLAHAEIGPALLERSDDGYNVLVGGRLFPDYARHPRILVSLPRYGISSTAAGRYQFLARTWDDLTAQLGLKDFSPESQDRAAVRMFSWAGALEQIKAGKIAEAIERCRKLWASLPGAGYGQREVKAAELLGVYRTALEVYQ